MLPTRIRAFVFGQVSAFGLSLLVGSHATAQELYKEFDVNGNGRLFGATMVLIDDLDNDGVRDLAVGEPHDGVLSRGPGRVRGISTMSGAVLWTASLGNDLDLFGKTLISMGDVDGDGFVDLAAGAPNASSIDLHAGSVAIVSGRDGTLLAVKNNRRVWEQFGASLTKTHDVDGDGVDDLAAGAPGAQRGGLPGLVRILSATDLKPIVDLQGDIDSVRFGESVASAGDVDGDGVPEIWVGDTSDSRNKARSGAIWIFSGATQTVLSRKDGKILYGAMGLLANIGDHDGDGLDEVLTGIDTPNEEGRLVAFSGATGSRLFRIDGGKRAFLGQDVMALGDVTGDGHPDFGAIALGVRSTRIYDGQTLQEIVSFPPSDSWFHESLVLLDDLDGDGRRDFARGMPGWNAGGINSGRIELRLANDLYLYTDAYSYLEGSDLSLHVRTGEANARAAVFVEEINGVASTFVVHFARLDANGSLDLGPLTVPPGLSGIEIQLRAFAEGASGVEDSAQSLVRFL